MIVGIPKETFPGERRVALVPSVVPSLTKAGLQVVVEAGAGLAAGFTDAQYQEKGGRIGTRGDVFGADIVLQVRCLGANPEAGRADLPLLRAGQALVGFAEPLSAVQAAAEIAARGSLLFAMELIPRITRAQSMDALSSMATITGYKGVLLAANTLAKMFPMMMTAAGTITPARVFVLGAGVAGLQAIASSRRMGAVVHAYDVRPAVKEQVESLGAKFLDLPLPTEEAQDKGGYAKQLSEEVYARQREMMARALAESDGGGARRQLRADAPRRDLRQRERRADPGAAQSSCRGPLSRQPDVCQERGHAAVTSAEGRPTESRHGRRNHARDAGDARRPGGASARKGIGSTGFQPVNHSQAGCATSSWKTL
jgi:NAD/NADP transhydrogenase alpha subunit